MKTEIIPQDSNRTEAFSMWMSSPMPMVTLVKTLDVSRLVKVSKKSGMKFNMLLCWCIGKAASGIEEFYTLVKDGKMYKYDCLAISPVVTNCKGGINYCDIPFSEDLNKFNADYTERCAQTYAACQDMCLDGEMMVIGTSAVVQTDIDCIVNQYSGIFNNPFLAWGRYRKGLFKTTLPISFQFHHVQMDGKHAACFLNMLQKEILLGTRASSPAKISRYLQNGTIK